MNWSHSGMMPLLDLPFAVLLPADVWKFPLPTFTGRVEWQRCLRPVFFGPVFLGIVPIFRHILPLSTPPVLTTQKCVSSSCRNAFRHIAAVKGTKLRNRALQQRFNRGKSHAALQSPVS
jgi:hypothetical protein